MALKGQIIELKNIGNYAYLLRVGIVDDALEAGNNTPVPDGPLSEYADDSLSPEMAMRIYECRLDLRDNERPITYPLGELTEIVEVYHNNKTPVNLSFEDSEKWKIGFIIDTIISECFATDSLEVIYGDEWEMAEAFQAEDNGIEPPIAAVEIPSPQAMHISGRKAATTSCPDCGAEVKLVVNEPSQGKSELSCLVCGRHFDV
ncbi:MAG: hypothetical protein JNL74_21655 [Fibrobacteres bacterium]|nr:hypothetical protein [Fibrobacterota bacterium]